MSTSNSEWIAWIEKGRWLWHWTVEREWDYSDPTNGLPLLPSRGDYLNGWTFTEASARRKCQERLANRIEWSKPKPDKRIFITTEDQILMPSADRTEEREFGSWTVGACLLLAAMGVATFPIPKWVLAVEYAAAGCWVLTEAGLIRLKRRIDALGTNNTSTERTS